MFIVLVLGLIVSLVMVCKAAPMGTAWTYQGRLMDTNIVADGLYDFKFKLFNEPNGTGSEDPLTNDVNDIDVIDGYFTAVLDFGSDVFNGDARWLEILVRPGDSNDVNDFVTLSPRQEVTPTPYALQTRGIFVDNSENIGMGTTNPKGKLHVDGGKAADDTDAGEITIKAQEGGDAVRGLIGGRGGNIILLPGEGGQSPPLTKPGPSGNVGIGTAGPVEMLDVSGNINYSGKLTKLDVADNFLATVGAADFMLGHSSRRGTPGRALVDFNDALVLNFDGDWDRTDIHGATTYITGNVGIGTIIPEKKLTIQATRPQLALVENGGDAGVLEFHEQENQLRLQYWTDYGSIWNTTMMTLDGDTGNVGIGTTEPGTKLMVHDSTSGATIWAQNNGDGQGLYSYCEGGSGVWGDSVSGPGLNGYSVYSYGVLGYSMTNYAGYFDGDVYVKYDVSALTFTDRTPYPKDLATAYEAVMSMERLPDGQYDENNKEAQLDHSMLSDFVRSKDGNRDLSATVSAHNEVLKDLIRKQQELGKAHIYIEQLHERIKTLEEKLVKVEAVLGTL
jgi:hypothetical protein